MARFNKEALDQIKSDPDLYTIVCKALKVAPASMPMILHRNGKTLNEYSIVTLVADHLGKKPEELLEEEVSEESENETVK